MSEKLPSKLVPELQSKQPELLSVPSAPFFTELERDGVAGDFTGERLWKQRPDTYKAIVVLLGQKMGVIAIGKALQVSPNTVMAVRDREGGAIDIVKDHLAKVAHGAATMASELISESLNAIGQRRGTLGLKDLKDLAVVYGILVQNGQLLAGQPTARVEVTELQAPDHDDFNRYLASLKSAAPMGGAAEKSAQKGPGVVDLEPAAAAVPSSPSSPAPGTDAESDAKPKKP